MAARQGRGAGRPSSTSPLRALAEGLRVVTVLLHAYMPATHRAGCSPRSGSRSTTLDAARFGAAPAAAASVGELEPLFPKPQ